MPVEYGRLAVTVVTHSRPVARAVAAWAATLPDYRSMRVVVNHPLGAEGLEPPRRCEVVRSWRPPEHPGCMSEVWNQAMVLAFRDPAVDWLLCAMDDCFPEPGWSAVVARHDADLYLAPAGDTAFLLNRRAFGKVGWFDEVFRVIGYQEWDWEARAVKALGADRVVIEDLHGWTVNGIGLREKWVSSSSSSVRDKRWQWLNRAWLETKWGGIGAGSGEAFWAAAMAGPGPVVPEVDWYPWVDRGADR